MNSLIKKTGTAAALAVLALGATAHAQTVTAGGQVGVGNDFTTSGRGNSGSILFATTPAGTAGVNGSGQNVDSSTNNQDPTSLTPFVSTQTTPPLTATTVNTILPTFATIAAQGIGDGPLFSSGGRFFGNTSESFGNNFAQIAPGLEAGYGGTLAGPTATQSANLFRFTLGANAPANFTIGVLTDFAPPLTGAATAMRPNPNAFNLGNLTFTNGADSSTVTQADSKTALQQDFLFNITGARPGDTLFFSGNGGGIGQRVNGFEITTTAPAPSPEPSSFVALGLGVLGLAGLTLKARRRVAA